MTGVPTGTPGPRWGPEWQRIIDLEDDVRRLQASRVSIIADLLEPGCLLGGRPIEITFPDGLPFGMASRDELRVYLLGISR